jgi:hypothetical protein
VLFPPEKPPTTTEQEGTTSRLTHPDRENSSSGLKRCRNYVTARLEILAPGTLNKEVDIKEVGDEDNGSCDTRHIRRARLGDQGGFFTQHASHTDHNYKQLYYVIHLTRIGPLTFCEKRQYANKCTSIFSRYNFYMCL